MDIMDIANLPRVAAPSLPPLQLRDTEPLDKTTTGTSVTFTLSPPSEPEVVYARPVLPAGWTAPEAVATRNWAKAPQDAISELMARNLDQPAQGLASQWKGLGAALLNRFKTTQADYTQTVADSAAPELGVKKTLPTEALAAAVQGRTTVSLELQTRSGQTVTLTMAVGSASTAASKGMHVAVQVSGTLSAAERDALVRLADGFDQALDGLGQASAVQLNLAGLLGYDSAIFSRIDLSVKQAGASGEPGPLGHFEWHAGADESRISLQGRAGNLAIGIDVDTSSAPANLDRQQAMLRQYLAQFDAAADRSHSNADLVAQFKRAFVQMHEAAQEQAQSQLARTNAAPTSLAPLQTQVQRLLSGLQDFKASFDGDFTHANSGGLTTEAGHSDFQASQKTTTEGRDPEGAMNISQTQSSRLAADYVNNSRGGMLDTASGNYDSYRIRDHSETTPTIDMARKQLIGAVVTGLQDEWLGYEKRVNHKLTESRETPSRKVLSRNLL